MSTYNGLLSSLTKDGSTVSQTLTGVSTSSVVAPVPAKYYRSALFGVLATQGVSGAFGVYVIGAVGGATFVIAGTTGISAVGSYVLGTTGGANYGTPRPSLVSWESAKAVSGFTASIFMACEYH